MESFDSEIIQLKLLLQFNSLIYCHFSEKYVRDLKCFIDIGEIEIGKGFMFIQTFFLFSVVII